LDGDRDSKVLVTRVGLPKIASGLVVTESLAGERASRGVAGLLSVETSAGNLLTSDLIGVNPGSLLLCTLLERALIDVRREIEDGGINLFGRALVGILRGVAYNGLA
jgi:hypothetical protein